MADATLDAGGIVKSVSTRFWEKVILDTDGCWTWTGFVDKGGYARLRGEGGKNATVLYAHRFSYEIHHGNIPEGLVIDHLCRNRACVNHAHMEVVTPRENSLRGHGATMLAHAAGTCVQGHDASELYHRPSGGVAYCKACAREKREAAA